ncbi:hypothetical protein CRX72_20475 [Pantoea sp. BRM17]|nr:hypothetical protein CRX72_20475 [Pantoea sp. BRM17]
MQYRGVTEMIDAANKAINTVIDSAENDEVLRSDAAILLSELQNLLTISQAVDKADGEINHAGLSELTGVARVIGLQRFANAVRLIFFQGAQPVKNVVLSMLAKISHIDADMKQLTARVEAQSLLISALVLAVSRQGCRCAGTL